MTTTKAPTTDNDFNSILNQLGYNEFMGINNLELSVEANEKRIKFYSRDKIQFKITVQKNLKGDFIIDGSSYPFNFPEYAFLNIKNTREVADLVKLISIALKGTK